MSKSSATRADIRPHLEGQVERFRKAIGYAGTMTISGPYYPYDDRLGQMKYPSPDDPGCYVFATGDGTIKYIGKASRYLGTRIWAHIGRRERDRDVLDLYPQCELWLREHAPNIGVWSIALRDEHWFLAPALEGFLTEALLPGRPRLS
jgi:hypothetical protein